MWIVDNRTPFAADRCWVRGRDGAEHWLVAVKCTFEIHPDGTTTVAPSQAPVTFIPEHFGAPAETSLRYDTDFVLTKPTTDVILHGTAHAPNATPTTAVDVTMRVGNVHKTLRVTGERQYHPSLLGVTPGPPQPFVTLPLAYERAYGGAEGSPENAAQPRLDERNPVGVGYSSAAGGPVHTVQYPNGRNQPAGFGPIPPSWKPRSTYAGTYDDAWLRDRYPLYPADLDDRFFLCAPEDQWPREFLRGGETVELINLTPGGRLLFSLPRVAFGFETYFRDGQRAQHRAALHTVVLEPDVPRVILVWRTSLQCHHKVQLLARTMVWQKQIKNDSLLRSHSE